MKTAFVPLFLTSVMVFSSLAGCVIDQNSSEAEAEVLAVFKITPNTNIRVGDTISFDASSSTPSNSLTYRWDFDEDDPLMRQVGRPSGNTTSQGRKSLNSLYLMVPRPLRRQKTVTVNDATAIAPTAEITQYADDEDCSNDER